MYTLLKSKVGAFPEPETPRGVDLKLEDRKARRRLYAVTALYSAYFLASSFRASRWPHPGIALGFVCLGIVGWVPIEYLVHRYILHGVFPKRAGWLGRSLHHLFDAAHADHHARPWDGMYINGHLSTLPAAAVLIPLSFLAPHYSVSLFVATVFQCFVAEEWIHHAIHFWNFKSPYFQYLRRRHLYHHSRRGAGLAYGITSGMWDTVSGTRIQPDERQRLSLRSAAAASAPARTSSAEADPSGYGA